MMSQRGVLNLFHSDGQCDAFARRGNAMLLQGDDAELLTATRCGRAGPFLNFDDARFPIHGGLLHRRGGTARHDAVAWGFARGADARGVDLIQNCEVTGIPHRGRPGARRRDDARRDRGAARSGMAVAGRSSQVGAMAGPAAADREPRAAGLRHRGAEAGAPGVVTFGMGHFYISQSDKGGLVFGGDLDFYNSYAARGNLPTVEHVMEAGMALMPMIGSARVLRSWGGIVDMTMDGSPIIDRTPVEGLFFNGGWCYGGFKATPASGWCFAHLIATGEPHPAAARLRLDRFATRPGASTRRGRVRSPTCTEGSVVRGGRADRGAAGRAGCGADDRPADHGADRRAAEAAGRGARGRSSCRRPQSASMAATQTKAVTVRIVGSPLSRTCPVQRARRRFGSARAAPCA